MSAHSVPYWRLVFLCIELRIITVITTICTRKEAYFNVCCVQTLLSSETSSPHLYRLVLPVNKCCTLDILSPAVDGVWRGNRGFVNRLGWFNGTFYALRLWAYIWRGLYMEGVIHGGACFRNFTVNVGYKRWGLLQ